MGISSLRSGIALERNILVLGSTSMIAIFGNYLWFFFLPNYFEATFGANSEAIGIIYGAWFLAVGLGSAPAGALADRIGRKNVVVISGLISGGSIFLLAFSSSSFLLAAIAFPLSGLGTSFMQIANVMIAETVGKERRGVAFGTFQTFAYAAAAFSPLIGGLAILNSSSYFSLFIAGALLTILATFLRWVFLQETLAPFGVAAAPSRSPFSSSLGQIFHNKTILALLLIFSMYNLLLDQKSFILPLYTSQVLGLGSLEQGIFFSVLVAIVAILRLPSGKLSDKIGRRRTIAISWIGESLFVYLIVFAPRGNLPLAALGVTIWMIFGVMDSPAINAWLADATEARTRGLHMGTFYSVTSLIALPGAVISGFLFSISPELPFYVNSALGIIALILLLALTKSTVESFGKRVDNPEIES